MADFERTAELSIELDDAELRRTRGELEDALADIPVGVDASGGAAGARGGGDTSRERRRRRREFRWARQRTDDIETQVEILENIEGELTEGGLGGGGGLAGDLLGLGGEGAGIATDLGTSVVDAVAPALGSLAGTVIGEQVSGGGGGGGDSGGGGGPLKVKQPVSVTVNNSNRIPVETQLDGIDGGDDSEPALEPTIETDLSPTIESTVEPTIETTLEPTIETTVSPDFSPELAPEISLPNISTGGGGGSGLSEPVSVVVENTPLPVEGRRAGGGEPRPAPTGGGRGNVDDPLGLIQERALAGGATGALTGGATGSFAGGIGALPGAALGGGIGLISGAAVGAGEVALRNQSGSGGRDGGAPSGMSVSTGDVNVTMNVDVQSAVQQAMERVRREQERQRQQLRSELEGQINDLERQLSGGRGGGVGGSAGSVGPTR